MIAWLQRRVRRDEAGQSIFVEFLVILLPLMILTTNLISAGMYIYARNVVDNAAQAAVEQVASTGYSGVAQGVVDSQLSAGGLHGTPGVLAFAGGAGCANTSGGDFQGAPANVIVSYQFQPVFGSSPLFGGVFSGKITAGAQMPVSTEFQCG
jgi:hypothetical protein